MILRKSRRFDATLRRAGLATAALAVVTATEAAAQQSVRPGTAPVRTAQAAPQGQRPPTGQAQPAQAQRPAPAGQARPAAGATPARPAAGTPARPGAPAQPAASARPAAPAAQTTPARPAAAPAGAPGGAGAALIGTFGDWAVYAAQTGRSKICYALAQPAERLPKNLNRDPAYLFVSFRPAENVRNEIALVMGFATKEDAPAEAAIGPTAFALLPKGASAWLRNPAEEGQAIAAMRRGQSLAVKVQSARGNALTDRYSLTGFGQALERAQAECG
ncbi:MAG TPA: hypothetical protein VHL98_16770 [Microvirga sp.]|nr:hypothetical protein [Microvirga sp.]